MSASTPRRLATACVLAAGFIALPRAASGQSFRQLDLSVGAIAEHFDTAAGTRAEFGAASRVDVNLSPHVAIETRWDFYPRSEGREFKNQGGRTLDGSAGLRFATSDRRVQLSGTTLVGFRHVTNTVTKAFVEPSAPPPVGSATSLSFSSSVATTVRLSANTFARVELELFIVSVNGERLVVSERAEAEQPAFNWSRWRIEGVVGRRFGSVRQAVPPDPTTRRLTVGLAGARSQYATSFLNAFIQRKNGVVGFVSYSPWKWFDVESAVRFYRPTYEQTPYEGGTLTQVVAGIRSGARQGRFAEFAVLRAGIDSWSQKFTAISGDLHDLSTVVATFKRATDSAVEFGAAVEADVTRRLLFRTEVIDHVAFHGDTPFSNFGDALSLTPTVNHSLGITLGMGVRF